MNRPKNNNNKTAYFSFLVILLTMSFAYDHSKKLSPETLERSTPTAHLYHQSAVQEPAPFTPSPTPQRRAPSAITAIGGDQFTVAPEIPLSYKKVLLNAHLEKSYQMNGAEIKIYKRPKGSIRWVRLRSLASTNESAHPAPIVLTRADQLLIRVNKTSSLKEIETLIKNQEPSFKISTLTDGIYIASFSPENTTFTLDQLSALLYNHPQLIQSVSEDFIYTR